MILFFGNDSVWTSRIFRLLEVRCAGFPISIPIGFRSRNIEPSWNNSTGHRKRVAISSLRTSAEEFRPIGRSAVLKSEFSVLFESGNIFFPAIFVSGSATVYPLIENMVFQSRFDRSIFALTDSVKKPSFVILF